MTRATKYQMRLYYYQINGPFKTCLRCGKKYYNKFTQVLNYCSSCVKLRVGIEFPKALDDFHRLYVH